MNEERVHKPIKVEPLMTRGGYAAYMQYRIRGEGVTFFQSYNRTIAAIYDDGEIYLDVQYWDSSSTSARYREQFLGVGKKELKALLRSGVYKFANLN